MKPKEISIIASILTLILGVGTILLWDELLLTYPEWGIIVAASIFLGYSWSSYSRSKNHEKSKQVCLYISSAVFLILLLAGQFGVDFFIWLALVIVDVKLKSVQIEQ